MDVLEACSPMNVELQREQLPSIGYRLSADYGRLEVARCSTSESDDLFGSTINICSKINRKATPNGMVIGGDLYTVLRSLGFTENFRMQAIGEYAGGSSRYSYPIYSVTPRQTRISWFKGNAIRALFPEKWQWNNTNFKLFTGRR